MYAHFYGIVSYSDGTNAIFDTSIDDQGRVAYSNEEASANALAQVKAQDAQVQNMLNLLLSNIPTVSGNLTESAKTVTDVVAKLHGRISQTDGTSEDFIVQFQDGAEFVPNGGGVSAWVNAVASYQTELDSMFKKANNDTTVF